MHATSRNDIASILQLGTKLFHQKDFASAIALLDDALLRFPDQPDEILKKILGCCIASGQSKRGYEVCKQLVERGHRETTILQAMVLLSNQLGLKTEATEYQLSLAIGTPAEHFAKLNRGFVLRDAGQLQAAWDIFRQIETEKPDDLDARYQRIFAGRRLCRWDDWDADVRWLAKQLERPGPGFVNPYLAITYEEFTPSQIKAFAAAFSLPICKPLHRHIPRKNLIAHQRKKIRIGFLSADFFAHATTHLMIEFLECRNTADFETFLYSYKKDLPNDTWVHRCRQACERFIDISELNDEDAARLIASDEVDILIDVKGFNVHARLGILAYRSAPIQMSWLAYPGTLGQPDLADYIVGDPIVTPLEHADAYSEKILNLPVCYQSNKRWQAVDCDITRAEAGLPEKALVFCSFNQTYKLTPQTFDRWCQLMRSVPGSVLWLLEPPEDGIRDILRQQMVARGLAAERLIFAPKMRLELHEKRIALADIGLDTFPYTSHTTARDLFCAGVPLVAKCGNTFTSRVSSSLLHFMGLPELIAQTDDEWMRINLKLATDRKYRERLRKRIIQSAQDSTLYQPQVFSDAFYGECARLLGHSLLPRSNASVIYEDDHVRVISQSGADADIVFVFGDLLLKAKGNEYPARTTLTRTGVNVIAIMPKADCWYPSNSMESAAKSIERELARLKQSRRFLYGGSMGGYAALRYARLFRADRVLALVPQITIDPQSFGGTTGYDQYFVQGSGGQPIESQHLCGRITIVHDPLHPLDTAHVTKIAALQADIHVIRLRGTGHHATTLLVRSGLFEKVLSAMRSDDDRMLHKTFKDTRLASEWNCALALQMLFFRRKEALLRLVRKHRAKAFLLNTSDSSPTSASGLITTTVSAKDDMASSALVRVIANIVDQVILPLYLLNQRFGGVKTEHLDVLAEQCSRTLDEVDALLLSRQDGIRPAQTGLQSVSGLHLLVNAAARQLLVKRDPDTKTSHMYAVTNVPCGKDSEGLQVCTADQQKFWIHLTAHGTVRFDRHHPQLWTRSSSATRKDVSSSLLVHQDLGPLRFDSTGVCGLARGEILFFANP